jgi:uncharacterized protein
MPSRTRFLVLLAALLVTAAPIAVAQELKIPSAPTRWATDQAGLLAPATVDALDARLEAFERETGHQVIVYIGRTTGGIPIEEWAVKAFAAWKVGRKGLDDGLALFILADDRTMRIEVGYGLEERVPDIRAYRIINEVLVPGFRSGQQDAAVSEAVSRLLSLISGREEGQAPAAERSGRPSAFERGKSVVSTAFVLIAGVLFLILLITHPALALWLLFNIFSGGGRGGRGGGWGGGGFGGGGGSSGGGGASGSW